jgi:hypothetical protein
VADRRLPVARDGDPRRQSSKSLRKATLKSGHEDCVI